MALAISTITNVSSDITTTWGQLLISWSLYVVISSSRNLTTPVRVIWPQENKESLTAGVITSDHDIILHRALTLQ